MTTSRTALIWGYAQILLGIVLLFFTIVFLPVAGKLRKLDTDMNQSVVAFSTALKGSTDSFQKSFDNILPLTNDVAIIAQKLDQTTASFKVALEKTGRQKEKFSKWAKESSVTLPSKISMDGLKPKLDWKDHDIGPLKEFFEDRAENCADTEKTLADFVTIASDASKALQNQTAILADYADNGYVPTVTALQESAALLDGVHEVLEEKPITLGSFFIVSLGFVLSIMAFFNGTLLVSVGRKDKPSAA